MKRERNITTHKNTKKSNSQHIVVLELHLMNIIDKMKIQEKCTHVKRFRLQ